MPKKRAHGDDAIYWSKARQRWVGIVDLGLGPDGKRQRKTRIAETRPKLVDKLKKLKAELDQGIATPEDYTVKRCFEDWCDSLDLDPSTVDGYRRQAAKHLYPRLGSTKLRKLRTADLDSLFRQLGTKLSRRSLLILRTNIKRAIRRAQAYDLIGRNVAEPLDLPSGQPGRTSRAMTEEQARAVLDAARRDRLCAAFMVELTMGLRPGEMRALHWDHVDLDNRVMHVWTSTRRDRDTKTAKSRRTLEIPEFVVSELRAHRVRQAEEKLKAGERWHDDGLVFCKADGGEYTRNGWRLAFSRITRAAGLGHWHPHEARHTFVSVSSANGVDVRDIADYVGHGTTAVTESVYRKVITPKLRGGASVMGTVFDKEQSGG